jgi:hypothetical protein
MYACRGGALAFNSSNAVSLSTAAGPDPVRIGAEGDATHWWLCRPIFFSLHVLFACQEFIRINISVGVCSYTPNARHHSVDTTNAVQRAGVNADNTDASVDDYLSTEDGESRSNSA